MRSQRALQGWGGGESCLLMVPAQLPAGSASGTSPYHRRPHPGPMPQPTYAYLMPYYPLGSVSTLLGDIIFGWVGGRVGGPGWAGLGCQQGCDDVLPPGLRAAGCAARGGDLPSGLTDSPWRALPQARQC